MPVAVNDITGKASVSRISADRTCASRSSLRVSTEAVLISAVARESKRSAATTISPANSVKLPRTVVIRWRIVNVISECAGSIRQRPAARSGTCGVSDMSPSPLLKHERRPNLADYGHGASRWVPVTLVALDLDTELTTADERLLDAAADRSPRVRGLVT